MEIKKTQWLQLFSQYQGLLCYTLSTSKQKLTESDTVEWVEMCRWFEEDVK